MLSILSFTLTTDPVWVQVELHPSKEDHCNHLFGFSRDLSKKISLMAEAVLGG
jgi:hypothetical protein